MKMLNRNTFVFVMMAVFAFIFSSCEKKEQPIELPKGNDSIQLESVSLGANYDKQIFVNLETKQTTVIENNSWDLYFDSSPQGFMIYMNGGKGVLVAKTNSINFTDCSITTNYKWQWDAADGLTDSVVLSNWCNKTSLSTNDSVYIIDRGASITDPSRFMQFKIVSVNATKYVLQIADINGGNMHYFTVLKDPLKTNVYLSFDNGGTYLNFEPNKNNWQVCFLRYRWVYYQFNPPLLYTVTGAYLNTANYEAAVDSSMKFENITYNNSMPLQYNSNRDAVGFDWKVYNFTTGRYTARNYVNYILRPKTPGKLFKFRFIDYYDEMGLKGTPKFEVQGM